MTQSTKKAASATTKTVAMLDTAHGKVSQVANSCKDMCSGNISALVEAGNTASQTAMQISNQIMESNKQTYSDLVQLSRDAFACRTMQDVTDLQKKSLHQLCTNYLDNATKLMGMVFDSCNDAMTPINDRTAEASDQIRKAIAA